ncbi:MAG TPA: TRAP transporter small permease [Rhodocyclaceae bacterium]|nr:TRAP transporter small permease [Rhodocyclaceae bacterium]
MEKNPVERWCGPVVHAFSLVAGYAVLAITLVIGAEILLRRVFGMSLQGADEYGGYMLAIVTAIGAAHALLDRAHTRIEILVERLPQGARAVLNVASALVMAAMAAFLAWRAVVAMLESIEYQSVSTSPLMTPLWMPQAAWVAGMILFAVVASVVALHALSLTVGNWRAINRWYGIKTLSEELDEATAEVEPQGLATREARA